MNHIFLTFPDMSVKQFAHGISCLEVAQSISSSLAKKVIATEINGKLLNMSDLITENGTIKFILPEEGLDILRHDSAHMLAQAVKELFGDSVQITIGPGTKERFYYDFDTETPFSSSDLAALEAKMHEISRNNLPFKKIEMPREKAIEFFQNQGQSYKVEIIQSIPANEVITLYQQGSFIDLCRGPHSPSTGYVKYFKLLRVTGAYWRGDSKNKMLQRIYGTAFASQKDLDEYLTLLEEAKKRDHRKIGPESDLFHFQQEAAGSVFWHSKGWKVYLIIESYIREMLQKNGYQEVRTPMLLNSDLWKKSGHWSKYKENMFTISTVENEELGIKPMNCPCHVQIFNTGTRSYRDLPIRMAEFGCCHRYEASGALHGLMRVRAFTQDDAHIFCRESQINSETILFCNLLKEIYQKFGFTDIQVKFSTRPANYAGTEEIWNKAEAALEKAVQEAGLSYTINPGEGAFYGPKLEFILKDCLKREWQCGTLQVDYVLPERLNATYFNEKGEKEYAVMLHRAILGSFERFIGILIENYAGRLPLWLAPIQIVFIPISDKYETYVKNIVAPQFTAFRTEVDDSANTLSSKLKHYYMLKYPVIVIVGEKEQETNLLQVIHFLDSTKKEELLSIHNLLQKLLQ